jgi:hypothetical protein
MIQLYFHLGFIPDTTSVILYERWPLWTDGSNQCGEAPVRSGHGIYCISLLLLSEASNPPLPHPLRHIVPMTCL